MKEALHSFHKDFPMVTRIIMHWKELSGHYMCHCHLLEHEDHDMMRLIRVIDDTFLIQQPTEQ